MRITIKMLEAMVNRLNEITNSPTETYSKDSNGKLVANIGNFHLYQAYGGIRLDRITSSGGGIRVISKDGCGTKKQLYSFIAGYLSGIEKDY